MALPGSEPFFLLDESLSSGIVAEVSRAAGFSISTVRDEWAERDLAVDPPLDEEIIPHLAQKAGSRSVWITGDRRALQKHGRLIATSGISVIWLRGPGRRPVQPRVQVQMLTAVIARVHSLIQSSVVPLHFRVRLNPLDDNQPFLERLRGSILERPLEWQRVRLD